MTTVVSVCFILAVFNDINHDMKLPPVLAMKRLMVFVIFLLKFETVLRPNIIHHRRTQGLMTSYSVLLDGAQGKILIQRNRQNLTPIEEA